MFSASFQQPITFHLRCSPHPPFRLSFSGSSSFINGALNGIAAKGLQQLSGTDRAFAGVLAGVRTDLGRDLDFSKQGDREALGNALIKHVRQTGGCDLNGDKQSGCK